ncbi:MAG: pyruvate dehydrogenase E1 component alpha subunit [Planctomycetota bacterium]|jgi:pyruvate dehydrogenase E1 component alpha subunit
MTLPIERCLAIGTEHPATMPVPDLDRDTHLELFRNMLFCRALDAKLLGLQRQGRIGFHGPGAGQEAAGIGSGFALHKDDWVYPALREGTVLLMRGFPLEKYFAQMIGNGADIQKGRQMPCHFSSLEHRYVSLSSVIGTQIPQAVGTAMAAKLRGEKIACVGYLGDGASSSTDFHAAMTMAASQKAPVVLFCQNNGWAISVPFCGQSNSDGIAVKAAPYGIEGVRVDGNDVLAVYEVTRRALAKARAGDGPTLIEAVTYRRGGHSSSDDPDRYRDESQTAPWLLIDPLDRQRDYLTTEHDFTMLEEEAMIDGAKTEMDAAVKLAEAAPAPAPETVFEDVYAEMPPELERQMRARLQDSTSGIAEGEFPL